MNQLIEVYRKNIEIFYRKNEETIFFINELVKPKKLIEVKSYHNKLCNLMNIFKSLISFNINPPLEIPINLNFNYMHRITEIQNIYTKLLRIIDLISYAYGTQIIAIIAIQFISLTTLMYYFTMKIVK